MGLSDLRRIGRVGCSAAVTAAGNRDGIRGRSISVSNIFALSIFVLNIFVLNIFVLNIFVLNIFVLDIFVLNIFVLAGIRAVFLALVSNVASRALLALLAVFLIISLVLACTELILAIALAVVDDVVHQDRFYMLGGALHQT
ncbi:uncharacterized protein THITE_2124603 [Thermothielavioides terrestris NRRL 8126]|uniref:Uncharacterized protein n=1 Tax=Thermothielavioides terrestris (strain ATCC 38088 / NRRL 8126) TaxID=578455 RepID=G2RG17_THETT|nr:uncharacterized protein THITE_2124603 [Thermothielavioides terrestris NRRL 8126]AEO71771.1 hypothetical protein THITE_2124603 [Thermothielavioides terrestris NRRL 8126]